MIREGIAIEVLGTPAPKGSARAFVNKRTGRAFVAPGGAASTETKIKNWNSAVREAARDVLHRVFGAVTAPPFVNVPLAIEIVFRMQRPTSHWGTGKHAGQLRANAPHYPRSKPDIDKLARTTLDAMTGTLFDDDSRIARLSLLKVFAKPGEEGAYIVMHVLDAAPGSLDAHERARLEQKVFSHTEAA